MNTILFDIMSNLSGSIDALGPPPRIVHRDEELEWAYARLRSNVKTQMDVLAKCDRMMDQIKELREETIVANEELNRSIKNCNNQLKLKALTTLRGMVSEGCRSKGYVQVDGFLDAILQPLSNTLQMTELKVNQQDREMSSQMRALRHIIRQHCESQEFQRINEESKRRRVFKLEADSSDDKWVASLDQSESDSDSDSKSQTDH